MRANDGVGSLRQHSVSEPTLLRRGEKCIPVERAYPSTSRRAGVHEESAIVLHCLESVDTLGGCRAGFRGELTYACAQLQGRLRPIALQWH